MKANLKTWILEAAGGEPIEGVVIGDISSSIESKMPKLACQPRGIVLPWSEAQQWLDYSFDDSFGSPKCNAVTVWTPTKVMAVSQYDGATSLFVLPRHLVNHDPIMPGG